MQKIIDSLNVVATFFNSLVDIIGNIGSFLWSVISFIGYGITTGLSYVWNLIDHIFGLSMWWDFFKVFQDLSVFLGVDVMYLFAMFFVIFILIIFTFLTRLVFGKLNFANFDASYKKNKK